LKLLVGKGASPNAVDSSGGTLAHAIARNMQFGLIQGERLSRALKFIAEFSGVGGDVTIQDSEGNTAYHIAAREAIFDVLKAFISVDSKPLLVKNKYDKYPISVAAERGSLEAVNEMMNTDEGRQSCQGVNLDQKLLDSAIKSDSIDIVKNLTHPRHFAG
jgi:ankyrin repeat protein